MTISIQLLGQYQVSNSALSTLRVYMLKIRSTSLHNYPCLGELALEVVFTLPYTLIHLNTWIYKWAMLLLMVGIDQIKHQLNAYTICECIAFYPKAELCLAMLSSYGGLHV